MKLAISLTENQLQYPFSQILYIFIIYYHLVIIL